MAFTLGMTVDIIMHGIHAHARLDDPGWCKVTVGRQRQKISVGIISTTKQAISIKLATRVGLLYIFYRHDLDFENMYMA